MGLISLVPAHVDYFGNLCVLKIEGWHVMVDL